MKGEKALKIEFKKTARGFPYLEFKDRYDTLCNIQESSLATEAAIWFGVDDPKPQIMKPGEGWVEYPLPKEVMITNRMHLTQAQVKDLIPYLQKFVKTGEVGKL